MTNAPRYASDAALWIFGCIILACLVVSAPATFGLVAMFHHDGTAYGLAATVALLLVLEAGTVASKVAALFVREGRRALHAFCIAGLAVNGLSNLLHGAAVARTWGLEGAALWLGSVIYAVSVPVLIYLMLGLFCRRVQALQGGEETPEQRVHAMMAPVHQTAAQYAALMQAVHQMQAASAPMLPAPVVVHARPAEPPPAAVMHEDAAPMRADAEPAEAVLVGGESIAPHAPAASLVCPNCGMELDRPRYLAARRWGRCAACKGAANA